MLSSALAQLLGTDSRETVEKALAHYRERFADVGLFENRPYDGIAEALDTIAASGALLVVATSKPRLYARRIVEHFALGAHFSHVHGSELPARHHGVTAMGALWGYGSREELEAHGAQHLCASPRELAAALERARALG
jgi:phosphoglycolate phosphatase